MSNDRYDFVLFGATGFTGREALRYLAGKAPGRLGRWAIGGRSRARLQALLDELAPGRSDIDIVVADSADAASIESMVASTRVLIHLAGPYARHGENFIGACVRSGTHYVDLTGEIPWVRDMARAYHREAAEKKVKLVFTAGYEALPFDVATLLAVETMRHRHGVGCRRVDVVGTAEMPSGIGPGDMLSGGTMNTMREGLREGPALDADDPAALLDDEEEAASVRERSPIRVETWYDEALGGYIGPVFPAPFINPPIVLRSAALFAEAGHPYGEAFAYREGTALGDSWVHRIAAEAMCASIRSLAAALSGPEWVRSALLAVVDRVGPSSGEGPSERALAETSYGLKARAIGEGDQEVVVHLRAEGHPGYRSTARMIVETGLALAFDQESLPPIYGAITPASGIGLAARERLREAEIVFEVEGETESREAAATASGNVA